MPQKFPNQKDIREIKVGPMFTLIGDPTVPDGKGLLDLGLIQSVEITANPTMASGSIVGGHQLAEAAFDRSVNPEIALTLNDTQSTILAALLESASREAQSATITSVDDTAGTFTVDGDLTNGPAATGDFISVTGSSGNDGTYELASDPTVATSETTFEVVEGSLPDTTADGTLHTFYEGLTFETEVTKINPQTLICIPTGKGPAGAINESGVFYFPAVTTQDLDAITFDDSEGEDANTPITATMKGLYREEDQAGTPLPTNIRQMFTVPPGNLVDANLSWSLPPKYS